MSDDRPHSSVQGLDKHQVEVDELFLIEVGGSDVFENVWEECRNVLAQGHRHDGFLDSLLS